MEQTDTGKWDDCCYSTRSPPPWRSQTHTIAPKSHTHAHPSLSQIYPLFAPRCQRWALLRPIVKRRARTGIAFCYLGFGTDGTAPGNWGAAGKSTNNGQRSLPGEEGLEGSMYAACTVDDDLLCYRPSPYSECPTNPTWRTRGGVLSPLN